MDPGVLANRMDPFGGQFFDVFFDQIREISRFHAALGNSIYLAHRRRSASSMHSSNSLPWVCLTKSRKVKIFSICCRSKLKPFSNSSLARNESGYGVT